MAKDRATHYHNKGESDYKDGKYAPPHERVEDLVRNIVGGQSKSDRQDQKSYRAGRDNAKKR